LFDFRTKKWEVLDRAAIVAFNNWSKDGGYVYYWGLREDAEGIFRVGIRDRKVERVVSSTELGSISGTTGGMWLGLTPDDSPLLIRDTSIQEIYALDWELP
jgi:hypothetical protein